MSFIDSIADAIARQEGTGCGVRNNPGNLRVWGNLPTSGGFAIFPTCEAGYAALRSQVQRNVDRGLTLEEFFAGKAGVYPGYAPAADSNQPVLYAAHVSAWTGVPLGVPLDQLDDGGLSENWFDNGGLDDTTTMLILSGALILALVAIA
jgi:hypothetical protein